MAPLLALLLTAAVPGRIVLHDAWAGGLAVSLWRQAHEGDAWRVEARLTLAGDDRRHPGRGLSWTVGLGFDWGPEGDARAATALTESVAAFAAPAPP